MSTDDEKNAAGTEDGVKTSDEDGKSPAVSDEAVEKKPGGSG